MAENLQNIFQICTGTLYSAPVLSLTPDGFMSFKKLPQHTLAYLMPLVISFFMTCIVSAVSVIKAQGLNAAFWHDWPGAWAFSWLVAFPCLLVILPMTRKLLSHIVEP